MKAGKTPLPPGSTIGILGSGQLGRMLALVAKRMGYRTHVFSPESESPASAIADKVTVSSYDDPRAFSAFAQAVDVVTYEFENIPFETVDAIHRQVPVFPSPEIIRIAQNRIREKQFLKENRFAPVEFAVIRNSIDAQRAAETVGFPAILKTAVSGYDGKGQVRVTKLSDAIQALINSLTREWVWEKRFSFVREVSVLVARSQSGKVSDWGVVENTHANHILDVSVVPARVSPKVQKKAISVARQIATRLDLVGVLCVEFFVGPRGEVLVNELAPRPHNSGHWTIEGAITSQFEQQLRCVCGLELGSTQRTAKAAAMANVLGDIWQNGEPRWVEALSDPRVKWHSYGKAVARPGRKMGHLTVTGGQVSEVETWVRKVRTRLSRPRPRGAADR